MKHYTGHLHELLLEEYKNASASLILPKQALPSPGQYLQVNALSNSEDSLPLTLFPSSAPFQVDENWAINVVAELPEQWTIGSQLSISGPHGNGFHIPTGVNRLVLLFFGKNPARLFPLLSITGQQNMELVLISAQALNGIPVHVEIRPPSALNEVQDWADFLVADIPLFIFNRIMQSGTWSQISPSRIKGQVLISGDYPCAARAQCGLCAIKTGSGEQLLCEDGPVIPLIDVLA